MFRGTFSLLFPKQCLKQLGVEMSSPVPPTHSCQPVFLVLIFASLSFDIMGGYALLVHQIDIFSL